MSGWGSVSSSMREPMNTEAIQALTDALIKAHTAGGDTQKQGEQKLSDYKNRSYASFLYGLCVILGDTHADNQVRQFAGFYLKRLVGGTSGTSDAALAELKDKWTTTDRSIKDSIKKKVLKILEEDKREVANAAALTIANIAKVETLREWKELIPELCDLFRKAYKEKKPCTIVAVYQTLGFCAEECESEQTTAYAQSIYSTIKIGITLPDVCRCAAIKCLHSSLLIFGQGIRQTRSASTSSTLAKEIVQMLIACINSKGSSMEGNEMIIEAWNTLIDMFDEYYDEIEPFVPTIFEHSLKCLSEGVKAGDEGPRVEYTKLCVELWTFVADFEGGRMQYNQMLKKLRTRSALKPIHGYTQKAAVSLVPVYLRALQRHSGSTLEDDDDEELDLRKYCAISLEAISEIAGDTVLKIVVPFVRENLSSSNWELREGALCAFGMVLVGPSPEKLAELCSRVLPSIIGQMNDSTHGMVAKTANWVFAKICETVPQCTLELKGSFMDPLMKSVNAPDKITDQALRALSALAKYYQKTNMDSAPLRQPKQLEIIINAVISRSKRSGISTTLLDNCYQCACFLIDFGPDSGDEMLLMVQSTLDKTLEDLSKLAKQPDLIKRELHAQTTVKAMSSLVDVCLSKFIKAERQVLSEEKTDRLMSLLKGLADITTVYWEEILTCFASICRMCGPHFFKYLRSPELQNLLLKGVDINNHMNIQLCVAASGTVGYLLAICSERLASDYENMFNFSDNLLNKLIALLVYRSFPLASKQLIIETLVDISLGFGSKWKRYCKPAISNAFAVSNTIIEDVSDNLDELSALNSCRLEVMTLAHTSVMSFLEGDDWSEMACLGPLLLQFIECINRDKNGCTDEVYLSTIDTFIDIVSDIQSRPQGLDIIRPFVEARMKEFLNHASKLNSDLERKSKQLFNMLQEAVTRRSSGRGRGTDPGSFGR